MISFANDPNELNTVIRLWPDGPPSSLPDVGPEITFGSPAVFGPETVMLRNVSDSSLTVFTPDPAKANGVGIIVCPGGVWRVLAWEHEGINPARWLAARGYTAFLLKYHNPKIEKLEISKEPSAKAAYPRRGTRIPRKPRKPQ
jgi:hypothetical protein